MAENSRDEPLGARHRRRRASELTEPVKALKAAGASVKVVSTRAKSKPSSITTRHQDQGDESLSDASPEDFDGLVLPAASSPDALRLMPEAIDFVQHFVEEKKRSPPSVTARGP